MYIQQHQILNNRNFHLALPTVFLCRVLNHEETTWELLQNEITKLTKNILMSNNNDNNNNNRLGMAQRLTASEKLAQKKVLQQQSLPRSDATDLQTQVDASSSEQRKRKT